jgi:hypothetical protein
MMGTDSGGGATFSLLVPVQTGNFQFDVNDASFPQFVNTNPQGAWVISRTGASAVSVYKNGSAIPAGTAISASTSLSTVSFFLFARSDNGAPLDFAPYQASSCFSGGALSSTQAVAINNRINNYMAALGPNHVF